MSKFQICFDQVIPPLKNLFSRNSHTHLKRPMYKIICSSIICNWKQNVNNLYNLSRRLVKLIMAHSYNQMLCSHKNEWRITLTDTKYFSIYYYIEKKQGAKLCLWYAAIFIKGDKKIFLIYIKKLYGLFLEGHGGTDNIGNW